MQEVRCQKCNRLLFRGSVKAIEIKCPKCNHVQIITAKDHSVTKPKGTPSLESR
ncbi:Com family DNA-binding transcriptional regulator [Succinispira mobilis]|uniref:Com family DNA-binding transcriptional regulator n=1 Tax=Succinispira mobilis TaxID=78120 RepID=UPI0003722D7A|nr:Com family DNA-binding transcriptional regulator [Succinispira mobilis]